jgi:hypothetical protein
VTVYTGYENSGRNRIGVVTMRDNYDDAIAIDTSSTGTTASREWDGPPGGPHQVLDVSGSAFSYEARGIVSYGGGTVVRWTEAPYIFTAFGMTLAP